MSSRFTPDNLSKPTVIKDQEQEGRDITFSHEYGKEVSLTTLLELVNRLAQDIQELKRQRNRNN